MRVILYYTVMFFIMSFLMYDGFSLFKKKKIFKSELVLVFGPILDFTDQPHSLFQQLFKQPTVQRGK